jgi:hypothetical protein
MDGDKNNDFNSRVLQSGDDNLVNMRLDLKGEKNAVKQILGQEGTNNKVNQQIKQSGKVNSIVQDFSQVSRGGSNSLNLNFSQGGKSSTTKGSSKPFWETGDFWGESSWK